MQNPATGIFNEILQSVINQTYVFRTLSKTSKMEVFGKIDNGWKPLNIFATSSILEVYDKVLNTYVWFITLCKISLKIPVAESLFK